MTSDRRRYGQAWAGLRLAAVAAGLIGGQCADDPQMSAWLDDLSTTGMSTDHGPFSAGLPQPGRILPAAERSFLVNNDFANNEPVVPAVALRELEVQWTSDSEGVFSCRVCCHKHLGQIFGLMVASHPSALRRDEIGDLQYVVISASPQITSDRVTIPFEVVPFPSPVLVPRQGPPFSEERLRLLDSIEVG